MYKSVVYRGKEALGEVEVYPHKQKPGEDDKRIRLNGVIEITHFSAPSERCPPLAVLHTVTPAGYSVRIQPPPASFSASRLHDLHAYCLQDNKTAVMRLGDDELHLVAMRSRMRPDTPCFWGFFAASGLYDACLVMLNLRCLGIVFDLDETLVVANTMRSFEDRMEALQRKIGCEVDPHRLDGMIAELKRYQEDKCLLKQYAESDQVLNDGRIVRAASEIVPPLSDAHHTVARPIIRLPERNIVLTRINPQIRDTSVLVRLRPAWEDLRSYLIARGRKRFEVYVCTMAERDYALEMWRLLDPDQNLIQGNELLERIVCVKSGLKKSLFNVFQYGVCHPKMALVIDDRLKVWEENDQPRVHVVPAFAPYYAPQAEANNATPVLCVARNVACNIRGGFFKDFDEILLQRILDVCYEDDVSVIPTPPDVSNYLVLDEENKDVVTFDGMADAEVDRRLKVSATNSQSFEVVPPGVSNLDPRLISALQFSIPSNPISIQPPTTKQSFAEQTFQSSPAREEGEVPESELDPDTRRRLLILQHGQDSRENPPAPRPPMKAPIVRTSSTGIWPPIEEEMNHRQLSRVENESHIEKHRSHRSSYYPITDNGLPTENSRFSKEVPFVEDRIRLNDAVSNFRAYPGDDLPSTRPSSSIRDAEFESYYAAESSLAETPVVALQEIASKCGTKVEYRHSLAPTRDLQFMFETWFAGEKLSKGFGRTRREAQHVAAEATIKHLAGIYLSRSKGDPDPIFSGDIDFPGEAGTRDEGKTVSEKGWGAVKNAMFNHFPPKRQASPRSLHTNKRMKQEIPRSFYRGSSGARYPKNASQVYD